MEQEQIKLALDLITLIFFSMLGQTIFIFMDIRIKLQSPEFSWAIWRQQNLSFSIISLALSGMLIIIPWTARTELTMYAALMQGMALDSVLKTFKK